VKIDTFSAAAASLRRICGVHSDLSECVFVYVIVSMFGVRITECLVKSQSLRSVRGIDV